MEKFARDSPLITGSGALILNLMASDYGDWRRFVHVFDNIGALKILSWWVGCNMRWPNVCIIFPAKAEPCWTWARGHPGLTLRGKTRKSTVFTANVILLAWGSWSLLGNQSMSWWFIIPYIGAGCVGIVFVPRVSPLMTRINSSFSPSLHWCSTSDRCPLGQRA